MDPLTVFSQLQIAYYLKAAELTLFLCEYFQTFDREVRYIWGSKWHLTKVLFYIVRYTPFLDLVVKIVIVKLSSPSVQVCTGLFNVETYVTGLGMGSAQVFFCVRAYGLWGSSRAAFIFLFLICVLTLVFALVLSILITAQTRGLTSSLLPGCTYAQSTAATLVFTLLAAVFSAVLDIGLMIMILWARRRRFRGAEAPLVRKIYRDALAYFGIQLRKQFNSVLKYLHAHFLLVTHIISIILWFTLPDPLKDIPPALPRVMICIVTMRVILHLRQLAAEDGGYPEDTRAQVSTLEFNHTIRHELLSERTI